MKHLAIEAWLVAIHGVRSFSCNLRPLFLWSLDVEGVVFAVYTLRCGDVMTLSGVFKMWGCNGPEWCI